MRLIPLTRSKAAVVDDEDYAKLSKYNWCVLDARGLLYAKRGDSGNATVLMHRAILGLGPGDRRQVDHVDGNGLNNQRSNLRLANDTLNHANARPRVQRVPKSSRFKGVSWSTRDRYWLAIVQSGGKRVYVGYFKDEEAAARAYDEHARREFGEYARTNF